MKIGRPSDGPGLRLSPMNEDTAKRRVPTGRRNLTLGPLGQHHPSRLSVQRAKYRETLAMAVKIKEPQRQSSLAVTNQSAYRAGWNDAIERCADGGGKPFAPWDHR
jgi:hypothetical protein